MIEFVQNVKSRNETLYYFGLLCFIIAMLFLLLTKFSFVKVNNVNAWYKPFKFAIATFFYSWSMAWYCHYLPSFNSNLFNWFVIVLLGFEIVYITVQASKGALSHYNISTPLYSFLYSMMALAATIITIYTAYVGLLFFTTHFPELPLYYLWAIRLAIIIFVVFSFEGFVMGSNMSHTIGSKDGGVGIPILNWSKQFGDPRVAHFIGMHALQVLPILSFYVIKNTKMVVVVSAAYGFLALFTLIQALQGKPFFK